MSRDKQIEEIKREILFRGKTVSDSELWYDSEWLEGLYTCFNGKEHRIYTGYAETDCGDYYPEWFKVIPETVGQFIGLYDKNDKKIFEGDIVAYRTDEYGVIEYDEETARFLVSFDTWVTDFDHLYGKELEVIGNIHDNPELLKESEDTE